MATVYFELYVQADLVHQHISVKWGRVYEITFYIIQKKIKVHLPDEFDQYIETMLEDGEWEGEPENVAFSELYNANIHVFDAMISSIPYLIAENNTFTHTIYLLLTNNNHFDLLLIRGDSEKIDLKKINKREYKKKKTAVLKRNDKNRDIQREITTIYSIRLTRQ